MAPADAARGTLVEIRPDGDILERAVFPLVYAELVGWPATIFGSVPATPCK